MEEEVVKRVSKYIFWAPRVLGIIFVLFLMMFSLDVFMPGLTPQQIAIGLFMHNIPALLLLVTVVISWKHEIAGGVVFLLAGLLYLLILSGSIIIAGPAFLIGVLFLLSWYKKHRYKAVLEK